MAYETKDNSGAIFKNDRKESDTHADYKGEARIDGHDVWVNAWINKSKDGRSYMKLAFKRKDGTAERPQRSDVEVTKPQHDDKRKSFLDDPDQIPF